MSLVTLVRWSARALSGLIVLFYGFFLVAHLVGEQRRPPRPFVLNDYIMLATLVASLVGLMLAWKWQLIGAAVTLIAILICAAVNWKVLMFPGTLIPLTALLYLFSFWLRPVQIIAKSKPRP